MRRIYKKDIKKFYRKFSYPEAINDIPKASFLFVTRNRSPYVDIYKNPLAWSILSLVGNNKGMIDEIVVIDDNSSDYTFKTIVDIEKKLDCNIKYFKNIKRKGCSYSRQKAIWESSNDFIFMGDDDCLYAKDFVAGALVGYLDVMRVDKNIAVLNLPVYERDIRPVFSIPKNKIGKWNLNDAHFFHNFDKLPEEYLYNPKYTKHNILMPFSIDIIYGVNLSFKKYIIDSGGYDDLSMWDNDYSEHMELSSKLKKRGYTLYHLADPRIFSIHLKYGAQTSDNYDKKNQELKFEGLKYDLGGMIKLSNSIRVDTGARINDFDFHVNQIGSFFSFYLKISKKLGIKFAIKEYNNFVINDTIFSTTPLLKFKLLERRDIFKRAINMGAAITSKQTGKKYNDVIKKINKLCI